MFTMESEVDRWMKDRDRLSKRMETCNQKLVEARSNKVNMNYRLFVIVLIIIIIIIHVISIRVNISISIITKTLG